jgi:hypothetical protein
MAAAATQPSTTPGAFQPGEASSKKNEKKACHLFLDSVIPVNSKPEDTKSVDAFLTVCP